MLKVHARLDCTSEQFGQSLTIKYFSHTHLLDWVRYALLRQQFRIMFAHKMILSRHSLELLFPVDAFEYSQDICSGAELSIIIQLFGSVIIALDKALFSTKNDLYFSYFSTKTLL